MHDYEGTKLDTDLMEMLYAELKHLHSLDPFTQPGLWDSTVDSIRAIRTTIGTRQTLVIRNRFPSGAQ